MFKSSSLGLREPANLEMTSLSVSLGSQWSFLGAEVPALALLTQFRLAETAPQAIWHLPLLTARPSPNRLSCTCHKSPGSSSFANSSQDASRG